MKHERPDKEYFHLIAEEKTLRNRMKEVILLALKENNGRITFVPENEDDEYPVIATLMVMTIHNNLIRIFPNGSCILENPETGKEEKRQLGEINIEWMVTVWDYYRDLSGVKEDEPVKKQQYAFLYPLKHFDRNVTDNEILSGWVDGFVEKLTPDELAARINDECLDDTNFWIRFIEIED
jgi:hypothetical protein